MLSRYYQPLVNVLTNGALASSNSVICSHVYSMHHTYISSYPVSISTGLVIARPLWISSSWMIHVMAFDITIYSDCEEQSLDLKIEQYIVAQI